MKKVLVIIVILAAVGGTVGYYMYNKPHKDMAAARADHALSAVEFMQAYQEDEAQANEKYLGKIVEVTGEINALIPGDDQTMQIMLATEEMLASISCNMQEPRDVILQMKLQKGDRVTIKGQCSGLLMDVVLDRCVVVSEN